MLFVILHPRIMVAVDKVVGTGDIFTKMGEKPAKEVVKKPLQVTTLLLYTLFGFSIFLPLRLGTPWFYIGITVYIVGIVIFISALVTAAKTPPGCIFSQGMYRFSRHPLYFAFGLIYLGTSLAAASWLFLIISSAWMIFPLSQVTTEEQGCLDMFGAAYQEYMIRTPKWIGFPRRK